MQENIDTTGGFKPADAMHVSGEVAVDPARIEANLDAPAPQYTYESIVDTSYLVRTHASGFKEIVQGPGGGKPTPAELSLIPRAQEMINESNAKLGFPTIDPAHAQLALAGKALDSRRLSSQFAPNLPKDHPFLVASQVRQQAAEKGRALSGRNFRRLVKKQLVKNGER